MANRLTPPWKRISRGGHLNRPIKFMIEAARFDFECLQTGYMPGLRLMNLIYQGSARRRGR